MEMVPKYFKCCHPFLGKVCTTELALLPSAQAPCHSSASGPAVVTVPHTYWVFTVRRGPCQVRRTCRVLRSSDHPRGKAFILTGGKGRLRGMRPRS